jgi:threonine dehydrogenase-like Zn-dependent dehydrogenase
VKRRNLVVTGPGQVVLREEELPDVPEGGLLLRTVTTGLSAGTELTVVRGDHPALSRHHDAELGLFREGSAPPGYPVTRLGYMEVARVVSSRSAAFGEGDLVATAYGHATAHVCDPVTEHVVPVDPDFDPVLGVYVAHVGPICANGLLHAAAEAVGPPVARLGDGVEGRRVLITGAGLIGLVTGLFARHHGAAEIAVVDADPRRRRVADAFGFLSLDEDGDPAVTVKTRWRHGPGDHGADVVFQCRGRPRALATALRAVRPQGAVVDLAFYTDGADAVRLGEEFHHNGLTLRSAQIGRTPRGTAGHWDRHRLSVETVRLLDACAAEVREHLVTDVVPLEDAAGLMVEVARHRRHVLSAVFTVDG